MQPTQVAGVGADSLIGYLSHLSDGGSANGKWLMWNDGVDWQGNYIAADVTGISLAANVSSGSSPVSMRIAFDGPGGWFHSSPVSVGEGWNTYAFSLTQSEFTHVAAGGGSGAFSDTMTSVSRFELLSGSGAVSYRSNGDILQAGLGALRIHRQLVTGKVFETDSEFKSRRLQIMEALLEEKFQQSPFREELIKTHPKKIMDIDSKGRDPFWAISPEGIGENHTGRILEKIRKKLLDQVPKHSEGGTH